MSNTRGKDLIAEYGPVIRGPRTTTKVVHGYVWCDSHCCVHNDTTDPYGYGEPDCATIDHRAVIVRARPDEEF